MLNSRYEGFPHALIEAMTLGTSIIATNIKGNTTLVANGETGLLVPPEDDVALERALMTVANDPAAARKRAQKAKKHMDNFTLPHMLNSTVYFLKQLI